MADVEAPESRPASAAKSRPATASKSRPATANSLVGRPATAAKSRPASAIRSRPATAGLTSSRPTSALTIKSAISRPSSSKSLAPNTIPISPRSLAGSDKADDSPLIKKDVEKGCWHWFSSYVSGMWFTREMTSIDENKEIFVKTTIRELVVYCTFLVVLSIVTFGMTNKTQYYYTKVMTNLFSKQREVKNTADFWEFMEGQLLDGLYWEYWHGKETDKVYICPGGEEVTGPCPLAPSYRNLLYENRVLGLPRLRQLKVKNDSCEIYGDFQNAIKSCYNAYDSTLTDKVSFEPSYRSYTSAQAWNYQTAEEMKTSSMTHRGKVGSSYGGDGYIQNLHSLKNISHEIIKELKEGLWVTRGTRVVFVDFTVYNANINLFCVVRLTFEFPATGGVIPDSSFRTVKLIRYVNAFDYFVMACEFIFVMFIIYYIIEETLEIYKIGMSYFTVIWNDLDVLVLILSVINTSLNLYTYFVVETALTDILSDPEDYSDFNDLGYWSIQFKMAVGITVFFSWVKMFKYISFNKTMTQLASTLTKCAGDVAGFSVMFFIVFFAFAQLGYLLFGTQVKDFSSFDNAIFTLLRTILGDFNFHQMEAANRLLGPLFFLSYVFFVFFVLLNMFLAIINDTYSEVKAEIAAQTNEFELGDYMKRGYSNMLGRYGKRTNLLNIENALKLANEDGVVTYEEIRQNLKKCNFSDMEIEMFFAKYDIDGDGEFSWEEGQKLADDLDNDLIDKGDRPQTAKRTPSGKLKNPSEKINQEEFSMLNKRVDSLEGAVGKIVSKIDTVIIKLESIEKTKNKKREGMDKFFDGLDNEGM